MDLFFHNTLSKKKELFTPLDKNNIKMYVCGPTVYDAPHLGNARSVVVYDQLYRLLTHIYGSNKVTYVRNITDVDDKIVNAAKERNISIKQLTKEITAIFHEDMQSLNCLTPNIEPKATEHIAEMINIITKLIEQGFAYIANRHVYFAITKDPHYGRLAGRNLNEMLSGARVEIDNHKQHPGDFVLWKPIGEQENSDACFNSPWGLGRPGWHIECSAMSSKYLGDDFDIHGGGADLMFPHHTNEIAQSTCAHPQSKFAKYWIHNGFLTVNGEKMSKSLGNFITVRQLINQEVAGEVIRYLFLATHYRKPLDFNDKSLSDAKKALDSFYRTMYNFKEEDTAIPDEVIRALSDDLATTEAISLLHLYVKDINKAANDKQKIQLTNKLLSAARFLGLMTHNYDSWFKIKPNSWIEEQITLRNQAKQAKNWALADEIRQKLQAENIKLEDNKEGTSWKKT